MKVVFIGPTLPDATVVCGSEVIIRPPARHGDILQAVQRGAIAIGLVDGYFEQVAPVWHKEILFALSLGVRVYGAASMGALRAVECEPFGMIGIGRIFEWYRDGRLVDDADVGQVHGPQELGYVHLSIPLVNVLATLEALSSAGFISEQESQALETAACGIFFKERTIEGIVNTALLPDDGRRSGILRLMTIHSIDLKRVDALALIEIMRKGQIARRRSPSSWQFNSTSMWKYVSGR